MTTIDKTMNWAFLDFIEDNKGNNEMETGILFPVYCPARAPTSGARKWAMFLLARRWVGIGLRDESNTCAK